LKPGFSLSYYVDGVLSGNRVVLGQAITLVESFLPKDQENAGAVLEKILPDTGKSIRVGVTGVPGVGKSTFIEALGLYVVRQEKKIAVLSIDPSSPLTKGSILGDKTRMEELSKNPNAFIRPTASGLAIGGVANHTREAMLLCEAAGFDVIFVETVGVGQSEVSVKKMVDFFLLLMLAGAGDELQGIKKGIMEMADAIAITKADGDNIKKASEAQADYQHALHLFSTPDSGWKPKVLTTSALSGDGIDKIWKVIQQYRDQTEKSGYFDQNRSDQNIAWFHDCFDQLVRADLSQHQSVRSNLISLEEEIRQSKLSARSAAQQLLDRYHQAIQKP